jgi:hypothetical protein
MVGEIGRDQLPHRRFGGAVGRRHRAVVGLVVDRDGLAEKGPNRITGGIRKAVCKVEKGLEIAQSPRLI